MKKEAKSRIIVAWLLLMTLMPFFVVKATHFHQEDDASACRSATGHSHSADDCAICQFVLSPFTQAESFQIQLFLPVFNYQPVYEVYEDCHTVVYPYHLRAPPMQPRTV